MHVGGSEPHKNLPLEVLNALDPTNFLGLNTVSNDCCFNRSFKHFTDYSCCKMLFKTLNKRTQIFKKKISGASPIEHKPPPPVKATESDPCSVEIVSVPIQSQ